MEDRELQLRPGERFLDFQSLGLLGRGGVGEVHKIRYRQELQALKIIRPEWVQSPGMCGRMLNEGQILTRINHPNIVTVHDAGMTADGRVWIRMEFLEGLNLRELMRRSGRLSLPRICALLRTAAHALHQCHLFGIVHRDVKPENFMVVRDDDGHEVVKLLDFGLAKLYGAETQDVALIGTPQYMAPEQWDKRRQVSPATDLYALCLMGSEWHHGYHPFFSSQEALSPHQMMREHFHTKPPSPAESGMPKPIAKLVMKGLRKDPARRPQDALEWGEKVWGAWRKIRDASPDIDTLPGEPAMERIVSRPVALFGTSPVTGAGSAADAGAGPADARPFPVRGAASLPAGSAPLRHTTTVRMSPPPQVPGASPATRPAAGATSAAGGGHALTVKLPDSLRDPSCVSALEPRRAAESAAPPVLAGIPEAAPRFGLPLAGATSGIQAIDPLHARARLDRDALLAAERETPEPASTPEVLAAAEAGPALACPQPGPAESRPAAAARLASNATRAFHAWQRSLHHPWGLPLHLIAGIAIAALYAVLRADTEPPSPPALPTNTAPRPVHPKP